MQEVRTWRDVGLHPACVDILQTDWAVVVGGVRNTFVGLISWEAESTGVAMSEVVTSTSPAYSTSIAVELPFIYIVEKLADSTKVTATKYCLTALISTFVRYFLSSEAQ